MVCVSLDVAQPAEAVWAVVTDLANCADFLRGVERVEVLSDEGPFRAGLRWRETRVMMGREETQELEVGSVEAPVRYEVVANSCGTSYRTVFELAESGGGSATTRVSCSFEGKAETWMAWAFSWLGWLFEGQVKAMLLNDLEDMKAEVMKRAS